MRFQFLIGSLYTLDEFYQFFLTEEFQFLIGSLYTSIAAFWPVLNVYRFNSLQVVYILENQTNCKMGEFGCFNSLQVVYIQDKDLRLYNSRIVVSIPYRQSIYDYKKKQNKKQKTESFNSLQVVYIRSENRAPEKPLIVSIPYRQSIYFNCSSANCFLCVVSIPYRQSIY